ncbi:hypothetical protein ES708_11599 [subsurface metagenome]
MHGDKVTLDGWCPSCGKMRLWAPGYGYPELDKGTPHFDPVFNGAVSLICPACGYEGSFYVDVPRRQVFLVREVCSRGYK